MDNFYFSFIKWVSKLVSLYNFVEHFTPLLVAIWSLPKCYHIATKKSRTFCGILDFLTSL